MNKKIAGLFIALGVLAIAGFSPELARADVGILNVTGSMTSAANDTTPTFEIQTNLCYENPQTLNYVCNNVSSSTIQILDKEDSSVVVPSASCVAQDGSYGEYQEVLVCAIGQDLALDAPYVVSLTVQDEFGNLYNETSDLTLGQDSPLAEIAGVTNARVGFSDENGKLYGTFESNGTHVFSMGPDGANFSDIRPLDRPTEGGLNAGLFRIGSRIYGATNDGATGNRGAVFSMNFDGTDFALIHEFGASRELKGDIFISGGKVYGMLKGLNGSDFSLFSIDADGSNFTEYYVSGTGPYGDFVGPLVPYGGRFYGVSRYNGNPNIAGTVYSILPDGSDLSILKAFGAGTNYGHPYFSWTRLIEHNGTFYGFNLASADAEVVVYSVKADGSDFTVLDPSFYASTGYYVYGLFFHGDVLYVIGRETVNPNGAIIVSQYNGTTGEASVVGRFSRMTYPNVSEKIAGSTSAFGNKAYTSGYSGVASLILPSLSYSADPNGVLSGLTSQIPEYAGAGSAVTAVPDSGYQFVSWSDGSTQNPRVDQGVRKPLSFTASFEPVPVVVASPTEVRRSRSGGGSGRRAAVTAITAGTVAVASVTLIPPDSAPSSGSFSNNLNVGSSGPDVRALQSFLNSKGFLVSESGAGSPGLETEFFGPRTRDALARFQASVGISPALGFFGPITRGVIGGI